jgi:hypothetical protein
MTERERTEADIWADEMIDLMGLMFMSAPDRGAALTVVVNVAAMLVMNAIKLSPSIDPERCIADIATGVRAAIQRNLHLATPSGELH